MPLLSKEEILKEAERITDYWIRVTGVVCLDMMPVAGNSGESNRREVARQNMIAREVTLLTQRNQPKT